jgi:hypothetical protein
MPRPYAYQPYAVNPIRIMAGRFTLGSGSDAESMISTMEYPREGIILEWVKGLDSALRFTWDALVAWRKG